MIQKLKELNEDINDAQTIYNESRLKLKVTEAELWLETNWEEELGNKNGFDLTGYRKMYACKKQVRIVYSVVENVLLVNIIAIGEREDLEVYESASQRV